MSFSQLLIVVIAAIAVTIIAERRNVQAPLLIALVGLIASFIPGLPRLELEPHVILTVVLPPLLFSAATELSFVSFLHRLRSILNLGVGLVGITTIVVGIVAALVVPDLSPAAALVLAAVVSPPDAVTAVAIGRRLGLPNRLMTVLKGESLINDAAALTLFSLTAAAVAGTHVVIDNLWLYFLYGAGIGLLIGVVLGALVHQVRVRVANPSIATVLTVLVPFTAYLLAEEVQASGVIAVVAAGFSLGHNAPGANYAARIQERQVWKTLDALLEAFVFAYIGLQFRFVVDDAADAGFDLWQLGWASLAVLAAVILARVGWVFLSAAIGRRRQRRLEAKARIQERGKRRRQLPEPLSWRENLVLSWTGMRGVVTLAAAAGIPLMTAAGDAFPGREPIQVIAFAVTIGTLLLQGLTLPWLISRLALSDPGEAARLKAQRRLAEALDRQATIAAIVHFRDQQHTEAARKAADAMLSRFQVADQAEALAAPGLDMRALGQQMLAARRSALIAARDEQRLDDELMRELLEQLDLQEAVLATWERGEPAG